MGTHINLDLFLMQKHHMRLVFALESTEATCISKDLSESLYPKMVKLVCGLEQRNAKALSL